jgi:hypothetical protein
MTNYDLTTQVRRDTTAHRVHLSDKALAVHEEYLNRFLEEEYHMEHKIREEISTLSKLVYAPVHKLIEADSAAKAAAIELAQRKRILLESMYEDRQDQKLFDGPPLDNLIPKLHPGVNVFTPPYDFDVREPNRGQVDAQPNRIGGSFEIHLPYIDASGARWANAGVGIALQAGVTGVAHIRPAWQFHYAANAFGVILGSHTEGSGKLIVQDALTGNIIKALSKPLWNFDNDHEEQHDGYIDSWALGADFFVQGGQFFTLTFLASALADNSETSLIYWSAAAATMQMRVPLIVVEIT